MDLIFNFNVNCSLCEISLQYLLNNFQDYILIKSCSLPSNLTPKSNVRPCQLKLKVEISNYEEIKSHFSHNIYNEDYNELNESENVKRLKETFSIKYVADNLINCEKCHLIPFVAFNVTDNKLLGEIITKLNAKYSMPAQFKHLKRINSARRKMDDITTRVLLFPQSSQFDLVKADEYLKENNIDSNVYTQYIYFSCPVTRSQFDKYKMHWPCTFHPDSNLEKLLSINCGFGDSELSRHMELIKKTQELGELSKSHKKIGMIIYDPEKEIIVSDGFDCRESNIIHHAVMVGLDNLAKYQNDTSKMRKNPGGYLCTNWYVYISAVPCLMCSMALVHSRIAKLFYIKNNYDSEHLHDDGVSTQSDFKLFSVKSLNHNFDVYEIKV